MIWSKNHEKCNMSEGNRNVFEWCKTKRIKVPSIILNLMG